MKRILYVCIVFLLLSFTYRAYSDEKRSICCECDRSSDSLVVVRFVDDDCPICGEECRFSLCVKCFESILKWKSRELKEATLRDALARFFSFDKETRRRIIYGDSVCEICRLPMGDELVRLIFNKEELNTAK